MNPRKLVLKTAAVFLAAMTLFSSAASAESVNTAEVSRSYYASHGDYKVPLQVDETYQIKIKNAKEDIKYISNDDTSSFYVMDDKSGCLSCLGCVNRSSPADCTGTPKYSYAGCVDCFGITTSEDTKPDDIHAAVYICNGYYCVNFGAEENGKVRAA